MFCSIVLLVALLSAQGVWTSHPYLDVYPNVPNSTTSLTFGLMLSVSGDHQSTGALAGVQAALDDINSRDDLLRGYSLHYTLTDSKCNRTAALDGLFRQLFEPPQGKVALIGSGCSIATEATAEISHYYNLTHISCTSSLASNINRVNYFQMLPSEAHLTSVFYNIITEYGWRRVAFIVQNKSNYKAAVYSLTEMLSSWNPQGEYHPIPINEELGEFTFDSRFRIFVLGTTTSLARQLLCKAYELGMKYPKYVFITYALYGSRWWVSHDDDGCTSDNIAEVLQFSLAASHFQATSDSNVFYNVCYDAVQALAHSLHQVDQEMDLQNTDSALWNMNSSSSNCQLNYRNICNRGNRLHSLLNEHMRSVNFSGHSGHVRFGENGIREGTELHVLQYRTTNFNGTPFSVDGNLSERLRLLPVAHYNGNGSLEYINGLDKESIWPGYLPYDGEPEVEYVTVSLPVTIIFLALNMTGFIYAMICLLFNVIFQKKRLVRLDSPNLNYLIILGSVMIYTSCIAFVTPTLSPPAVSALCMLRAWLATMGCTLIYGTVIAKLWRINTIFRNPKIKTKKGGIKDHHLVLIVIGFVAVDVLILVVYTAVEGVITHFNVDTEPNTERRSSVSGEQEVETLYRIYTCSTKTLIRLICIGLLYVYTFFLYLCSLFYAFRLRKIRVKGLNDAKYIAAFVYISSIILIITFVSTLTLRKYINVYASVYSFGFWSITSTILGFLFIPKMIRYYKDPEGTTVFSSNNRTNNIEAHSTQKQENSDNVDVLKRRVKELENELNTRTE